ncbi:MULTISPECIES: purine-nucleoside phosphorylase [unclassified Microbacterium]|uniref:purine-nucleoside phosphorylase n=1 Tax=unclassified Microbacterium TaxID=2609290 RepID=UPI00214C94CF|nr:MULTISPECIES: purine-nucleoside phosphorylase [unclassified Microbacterium]MCR2800787.1 purine-nucleoside phosphorylase [Microbacterium sp. zg.Y818]MCR2825474.1 purine-nucleoside phosphorylase [Microbacterium sp. zg.Y909]MCR2826804.1 purine-nucleoside phosphorylase [Microbacterium sp. zg.Y909]WIM23506.1 purine-nucleoside phosphorylase [Microbacterium sp. zg-Y818]
MSTHIAAEPGQIAPIMLFPGDPLRAKWIAETFLDGAELYSQTRGMLGFTGTWEGRRVSVQGSGMGQPSMAIYANELMESYGVETIVRVGSCGALTERVALRDIIIANGASTDSAINRVRFHGLDYAPVADFGLLRAAVAASEAEPPASAVHVGPLFSSDQFYTTRAELTEPLVRHGVLGVEMETSGLYTLAAYYGRRALSICTVSDHLVTGAETTAHEREQTFGDMIRIALRAATS